MTKRLVLISFISMMFLTASAQAHTVLNQDQKRRLMLLTTIFENDFPDNATPEYDYAYIEDLHDGRGYTAGRIGFCTGTGDLLEVVEIYTKLRPGNNLTPFLPALRKLGNDFSDETKDLPRFIDEWKKASEDPVFRKAQDIIVDQSYVQAMKTADQLGIEIPFGRAILFDTLIMHGYGPKDPDSMGAIIARTNKIRCRYLRDHACPGRAGFDQKLWLKTFLDDRKRTLKHPNSEATKKEWSANSARATILKKMLISGEYDNLDHPMKIQNKYFDGYIP